MRHGPKEEGGRVQSSNSATKTDSYGSLGDATIGAGKLQYSPIIQDFLRKQTRQPKRAKALADLAVAFLARHPDTASLEAWLERTEGLSMLRLEELGITPVNAETVGFNGSESIIYNLALATRKGCKTIEEWSAMNREPER